MVTEDDIPKEFDLGGPFPVDDEEEDFVPPLEAIIPPPGTTFVGYISDDGNRQVMIKEPIMFINKSSE